MRRQSYSRDFFILLVALLLGSLILEPAGAQTSVGPDWEVFREPGFGFQIQYPEEWHVSLVADNTQRAHAYGEEVALRSIGFFGPNSQIVFVDVWVNRSDLSLSEWLARYPAPIAADPAITQTSEVATVAGKLARRQVAAPPADSGRSPWHYRTQFAQEDLIFSVEYAALEPNLDIYEQMLASFRLEPPTVQRLAASTVSDVLPPAEFGVTMAACCGTVDPEYNPFPCNTAGDSQCPFPPCGNCTWWVRYRRTGGSEANLVHCTGDAITWQSCANQYYPHLLSSAPAKEAVVLYPNLDHLSFVESVFGSNSYNASDLSWAAPCPANYFSSSAGGGKIFIHHPDNIVPNAPPNAPIPEAPLDDDWLNSRQITLAWKDGGDPDNGPQPERSFMAHVWQEGWTKNSSWMSKTEWQVEVPHDGLYTWRAKAHDGMLESAWSTPQEFGVDTIPPNVVISPGHPVAGRWYNTDQVISWTIDDPDPGSGVDYFKWAWNDSTPEKQVNGDKGSTTLSSAGQGIHNLYIQAWDKVAHKSALTQLGWFGYDTLGPTISFSSQNPAVERWYNSRINLSWTISDPPPGSGVDYLSWFWDSQLPLQHGLTNNRVDEARGTLLLNPTQGKHTLYSQAWDNVGNPSPINSLGWFGYDSLIPEPPSIDPGCEATNSQWQNTCRDPYFTWSSQDSNGNAGSGVADYAYTWGDAPAATSSDWADVTGYDPGPIAEATGWGRAYLHVQARDVAGNISSPATFGLWYDGSLPTIDFAVNSNADTKDTAAAQLDLSATDTGSGVAEVRIANNDLTWSAWQLYTPQVDWTLSTTDNPTHIVYVQVRDLAGNESAIASETVDLTVAEAQLDLSEALTPSTKPDIFRIRFAEGAFYTHIPTTTVEIWAPNAIEMRLSHQADYANQDWQTYQPTSTWLLDDADDAIMPKRLYVWFRDVEGNLYGPYFDDIIYDTLAPKGKVKILSAEATTVTLLLSAWDDNSGVAQMRFAEDPSLDLATWEPYTYTTVRPQNGVVIYVQFRDFAGNLSPIYGTDGSDSSLTERLYLPVMRR